MNPKKKKVWIYVPKLNGTVEIEAVRCKDFEDNIKIVKRMLNNTKIIFKKER